MITAILLFVLAQIMGAAFMGTAIYGTRATPPLIGPFRPWLNVLYTAGGLLTIIFGAVYLVGMAIFGSAWGFIMKR